nr:hypothetical protein BaRGS_013170 [Batillaria attramentaria]
MKLLSLLLVVVCFAYTLAAGEQEKELSKEETEQTEAIFKWEVEQAQAGQDKEGDDDNNNSDDSDNDQDEGNSRKRRSAVRGFGLFNPGYRYGRGYYYEEPARGAAFEVYDAPSFKGAYSYGLLGGLRLGGYRGFAGAAREKVVGYVGYMEDFPYQVSVLRSGCRLAEFPGFHDCIVFTGATYPYTRSIRKFVYVDRKYAAAVSGFSGYH